MTRRTMVDRNRASSELTKQVPPLFLCVRLEFAWREQAWPRCHLLWKSRRGVGMVLEGAAGEEATGA